jgi:antitoxin component of MazEF toxin-antitoxin module
MVCGRNEYMKATVKKWGNSAAVRIPPSVREATHLELDEVVDVREEKGRIVIEPVGQKNVRRGRSVDRDHREESA